MSLSTGVAVIDTVWRSKVDKYHWYYSEQANSVVATTDYTNGSKTLLLLHKMIGGECSHEKHKSNIYDYRRSTFIPLGNRYEDRPDDTTVIYMSNGQCVIDTADRPLIENMTWFESQGLVQATVRVDGFKSSVFLHKYLSGNCKHSDSDKMNNRRINLVPVNASVPWESPEYLAYRGALRSCTDPKHKRYSGVGAKGVQCLFTDFKEFFEEVGYRPTTGHHLARKDNSKHFEKGNVIWTTASRRRVERTVQSMGEAMIRALTRLGSLTHSELYARSNAHQWGAQLFNQAIKDLHNANRIEATNGKYAVRA
jgi:hypothetical protein